VRVCGVCEYVCVGCGYVCVCGGCVGCLCVCVCVCMRAQLLKMMTDLHEIWYLCLAIASHPISLPIQ